MLDKLLFFFILKTKGEQIIVIDDFEVWFEGYSIHYLFLTSFIAKWHYFAKEQKKSSDSEPSALTTELLGQSRGVGVPAVQLTTHVKSSTLYGFFGLIGYYYFV